jgi:hypothetical protein
MPPADGLGLSAVSRKYYMPAKGDLAVVGFRRWMQDVAGEVPTCTARDQPLMPPLMTKEQVSSVGCFGCGH